MEIALVGLVIAIVLALVYATWYRYDSYAEQAELEEEIDRLKEEKARLDAELQSNLRIISEMRAERLRLAKETERLNEKLHGL